MEIPMSTIDCPECQIVFAMPTLTANRYRESHQTLYCPKGHGMSFPQKTELDILREKERELAVLKDENHKMLLKKQKPRKPASKRLKGRK